MSSSIGTRLKSAREAKQLTLEEVAQATKVQRRTLVAIEEDRLQEVLESAYARIFLRRYAAFLGLDGSAILAEYLATHPPAEVSAALPTPSSAASSPAAPSSLLFPPIASSAVSFPWRILFPALLGLLFLIGIYFLGYLVLHSKSNKTGRPGSSQAVVSKPKSTVGEKVSAGAAKKTQEERFLVPRSQPLKLSLKTKADVWLQIKSDGMIIFQSVLPKGSQESWTAKDELELWTGNAGAMDLFLNGKPLEGVGTGVKKGIKVTHRGLE